MSETHVTGREIMYGSCDDRVGGRLLTVVVCVGEREVAQRRTIARKDYLQVY